MDILKKLKKMIRKCTNSINTILMEDEEPICDMSEHFHVSQDGNVEAINFPLLKEYGKGYQIGEGIAEFKKGKAYVLVNMKTGKLLKITDSKGNLLVEDKAIDFESIHDRLEHGYKADSKQIGFWIERVTSMKDGFCAMAWVIYPEGRWFEDEDGFGAEPNENAEVAYCIISSSPGIVIPFQPMDNMDAVLEILREQKRKFKQKNKRNQ